MIFLVDKTCLTVTTDDITQILQLLAAILIEQKLN